MSSGESPSGAVDVVRAVPGSSESESQSAGAPGTPRVVALVGNPNTGKSTLFHALSGVRQRTGNYPGVTVEKKIGRFRAGDFEIALVDLPGTYSLAPRSPDEMVTVDVLIGREPGVGRVEAVVCIVDASNLNRNLFLVSQVLSLGLPVVVALNMVDLARGRGIEIDAEALARRLGVPVVEIQANKRRNLDALREALAALLAAAPPPPRHDPFPDEFRACRAEVRDAAREAGCDWWESLSERLLLDANGFLESRLAAPPSVLERARAARARLAAANLPVPAVEAMARYHWAGEALEGVTREIGTGEPGAAGSAANRRGSWTDRIDRVLTHRVGGLAFFAALMFAMFVSIFSFADIPMSWIDARIGDLREAAEARLPEGTLRDLLIEGVLGGVGAVLVFLPQIMILFMFLAALEDCGYLARAAYLMDRVMARVGLSGKSFIPLLSAHACAIPAVMASRVIEDRRDRLATILVTPLMSCSARLPVYLLMIGAFVPDVRLLGGWVGSRPLTMFSMYALGILTAAAAATLFKRTLLKGPTPPFVMELPSYKIPSAGLVVRRMIEEGLRFVRRAGTLILAVSVVVWGLMTFPRSDEAVEALHGARLAAAEQRLEASKAAAETAGGNDEAAAAEEELAAAEEELAEVEALIRGERQRLSFLGMAGRWIEPAVRPLGWDWRVGCATIASFPAREVVVGVMGVVFNAGDVDPGEEEERSRLGDALRNATWPDGRPLFTMATALSLMVFFALCSQCAATLVVIRRETNSWWWPTFTFLYLTALAYVGALVTYQGLSALGY